ncbi:MAG: hypothetical protein LBO66_00685 [Deltaproteobacteria bacterium]|jgi:hypothetical protein|nr:hypothetical protein [Deltaproteobacteria bacterium]
MEFLDSFSARLDAAVPPGGEEAQSGPRVASFLEYFIQERGELARYLWELARALKTVDLELSLTISKFLRRANSKIIALYGQYPWFYLVERKIPPEAADALLRTIREGQGISAEKKALSRSWGYPARERVLEVYGALYAPALKIGQEAWGLALQARAALSGQDGPSFPSEADGGAPVRYRGAVEELLGEIEALWRAGAGA